MGGLGTLIAFGGILLLYDIDPRLYYDRSDDRPFVLGLTMDLHGNQGMFISGAGVYAIGFLFLRIGQRKLGADNHYQVFTFIFLKRGQKHYV